MFYIFLVIYVLVGIGVSATATENMQRQLKRNHGELDKLDRYLLPAALVVFWPTVVGCILGDKVR